MYLSTFVENLSYTCFKKKTLNIHRLLTKIYLGKSQFSFLSYLADELMKDRRKISRQLRAPS